MKIVITTPLYPPDIAEPAPYAKELTHRLSPHHKVTVVLFGRLPEVVQGVSFITIDKRTQLPVRLFQYARSLWQATKEADVIYVLDGSSVELIAGILSVLRKTPIVFHSGDKDSNEWISQKLSLRIIRKLIRMRAKVEIDFLPPQRPEVLPFDPHPVADFTAYEQSWTTHIKNLETLFHKIKT